MERKIEVNAERCIHCGLCIKDCMMNCIEFDENKIPRYAQGGIQRCGECQHCMAVCPKGALSFGGINPDNLTKTSYDNTEELLNLIKSRKSVRQYRSEDVPSDKLEKIINMLPFVPTGGNVNDLHFSIVETKEKMDEIIRVSYEELEKSSGNPIFEMCKNLHKSGTDLIYRNSSSMIAVATDMNRAVAGCENTDSIIALSYIELYAHSLGLGTLWCDLGLNVLNSFPKAYELLEIPENYTLSYIMLLGVPAVKYYRTTQPDQFSIKTLK